MERDVCAREMGRDGVCRERVKMERGVCVQGRGGGIVGGMVRAGGRDDVCRGEGEDGKGMCLCGSAKNKNNKP